MEYEMGFNVDTPAGALDTTTDNPTLGPSTTEINTQLQALIGPEPYILELPHTVAGVTAVLLELRKNTVQLLAVRLRRNPPSPVSELEWSRLAAFLDAMWNLEFIDPKMK
jgi:hypothetical protein